METKYNTIYKGLNIAFKAKTGVLLEIQFHNKQSLEVKEIIHKLYEEERLESTSPNRKRELQKQMIEISRTINTPKKVELIK